MVRKSQCQHEENLKLKKESRSKKHQQQMRIIAQVSRQEEHMQKSQDAACSIYPYRCSWHFAERTAFKPTCWKLKYLVLSGFAI